MLRRTMLSLTAATAIALPAYAAQHAMEMDIVETATDAGNFTTLATALESAGLVETLKGEGPFTVFAPTDEAFEALPEGTLDELTMEENQEQLSSLLTYHVVPNSAMSGDLTDGQMVTTVNGQDLEITVDGDTVMVNGATVTQADIEASNGVIHAIDTVLMPDESM